MTLIIVMSIVWGICATRLVRPMFIVGLVKYHTCFYDRDRDNSEYHAFHKNNLVGEIFGEVFKFFVAFGFSLVIYLGGFSVTVQGSLPAIIFALICQVVSLSLALGEEKSIPAWVCILVCVVWLIVEWIVVSFAHYDINEVCVEEEMPVVTLSVDDKEVHTEYVVTSERILQTYGVDTADTPILIGDYFVSYVTGGPSNRGVVAVDRKDFNRAYHIPIKYSPGVYKVRRNHPTWRFRELFIAVEENKEDGKYQFNAYKVYMVVKQTGAFSYNTGGYLVFNLRTGEEEFFSQTDVLPKYMYRRNVE